MYTSMKPDADSQDSHEIYILLLTNNTSEEEN